MLVGLLVQTQHQQQALAEQRAAFAQREQPGREQPALGDAHQLGVAEQAERFGIERRVELAGAPAEGGDDAAGQLPLALDGALHAAGQLGLVQQYFKRLAIAAVIQQQAEPFINKTFDGLARVGLAFGLFDHCLQRGLRVAEHRLVEFVLVAKMPVDRATAEAGLFGNHRQGGLRVAVAAEQLEGRLDDALAGLFRVFFGSSHAVMQTGACAPVVLVPVVYRASGDDNILIEYGEQVLDLALRFRVHALMEWLQQARPEGILQLTPGIRSLQVNYDNLRLPQAQLLQLLQAERALPAIDDMQVPSRIVHLPISWDDPQCRLAIEKYMQSVRSDAPWCPSNLEFIRRINGLTDLAAVQKIFFDASYMVLGLGDVYLGAPVATPVDPRHRLVTTKYNPARTWTPENAVGIGGAYLCVYGMEGPGGYQFVGRTLQMWNTWQQTAEFREGAPWLLRFFDQLRFYPVSHEELMQWREDFPRGRVSLKIEETRFSLRDYNAFLAREADSIAAFKAGQQAAFEAERERWAAAGQDLLLTEEPGADVEDAPLGEGEHAVCSSVPGSLWQLLVSVGQQVSAGDTLAIIESMKMEIPLHSPVSGEVLRVLCEPGKALSPGQVLVVIREALAG